MKKLLIAIALTPLVGCVTPNPPDNVPPPPPKRAGERITAPAPESDEPAEEGFGEDGFGGFGGEQPTVSADVPESEAAAADESEEAATDEGEDSAEAGDEADEPTSQPAKKKEGSGASE